MLGIGYYPVFVFAFTTCFPRLHFASFSFFLFFPCCPGELFICLGFFQPGTLDASNVIFSLFFVLFLFCLLTQRKVDPMFRPSVDRCTVERPQSI